MNQKIKQVFYNIRRKIYNFTTLFGYKYNLKIYDRDFFSYNQYEGVKMAGWFVPLLLETFHFKSLLDVGCATGHYLRYCLDHGIPDVFGLEGSPEAFNQLLVDKKYVAMHDLRKTYIFDRKWDLAVSIEVAEHIDRLYAENYVKILTDASDTVVLTAAPPGQGGTAHINEQPQEWWKQLFGRFNFAFQTELTKKLKIGILKAKQSGEFVTDWFEPNIMVFVKTK